MLGITLPGLQGVTLIGHTLVNPAGRPLSAILKTLRIFCRSTFKEMMMTTTARPAFSRSLAFIVSAILAGCGGGGGGGGSAAPAPTPTPIATATPRADTCTSIASRRFGSDRRAPGTAAPGVNPNRVYVTYRASAAQRATESLDRTINAVRAVELGTQGGYAHRALTLPAGLDATTAAATLRLNPDVVDVAPVHYRVSTAISPGDVVNDPLSDNVDQWYLYKTNVTPGAWTVTTGSPSISVAIIDTGVDETNTDFVFDVKESIVNGIKKTGNGSVQDTNGHGTNVAGLAVAQANNAINFAGVGYKTHLQAYKIFPDATAASDCQAADTADEAAAINDAVANGASVISLSLGSPQSTGEDAAEKTAVSAAIAANVTVVAANGNEFPTADGTTPDFPAAYPGVIGVGASAVIDNNAAPGSFSSITAETVASYSNSAPKLVAPGGDAANGAADNDLLHWIEGYSTTTAAFAADQCTNSGGVCRALFNGTSQATPQVAGTVALMMAVHGGGRSLTPARVLSILQSTADVLPGIPASRQGAGRLNAGAAVSAP
ncbi:MAG: S8 family serine peptidase [Candidatus Velthaea sp.]